MRFSPKITVIIIGAALTIVSAALTHFILKENNFIVEQKSQQQNQLEKGIDELWQANITFSQKKDFASILMPLAKIDNGQALKQYTQNALKKANIKNEEITKLTEQLEKIENTQRIYSILSTSLEALHNETIDIINDRYLEVHTLKAEILGIHQKNSLISSIALLFQILGLIFVLSKDVFRN